MRYDDNFYMSSPAFCKWIAGASIERLTRCKRHLEMNLKAAEQKRSWKPILEPVWTEILSRVNSKLKTLQHGR